MTQPQAQPIAPPRLAVLRVLWRQHAARALGVFFLLLALALRVYRLAAQSLWLDEGGTWAEVTGQGWAKLVTDLWSPNAAYPLYHLLLKGWVALAGDGEWALRFPSALAGAAATAAVFLAAVELERYRAAQVAEPPSRQARQDAGAPVGRRNPDDIAACGISLLAPAVAGLLCLVAPFAVWQAQDAKVYSLLMLWAALLLWALLRALRAGAGRDWAVLAAVGLVGVFVHRLAILGVAGALIAVALAWPFAPAAPPRRWLMWARAGLMLGALASGALAIYGLIQAVGLESRGGTGHIPAGPLDGLWLTVAHFALDRGNIAGWLSLPLLVWALPALALTLAGLALLVRDARRGAPAAVAILALFAAPLLLFAAALAFVRLFEARYVTVAFPAWLLVLSYPLARPPRALRQDRPWLKRAAVGLAVAVALVDLAVLWQPQHGLFSGAPVKEQWREGIAELARRAHPDDLVIVHPYYVVPMWSYYAPRVTPDPLPQPITFDLLGQGYCRDVARDDQQRLVECYRKDYEAVFDQRAQGHKRMLMLIAPDHARTIDPPKTLAELTEEWQALPEKTRGTSPTKPDQFGVLGLRFQYASKQRTWPCGDTGDALIGVEVMCASFPSFYRRTGPQSIPQPQVKLTATFGGELGLRGYTISPAGGALRPGGTLPITLYWAALKRPTRDYTMFLHLCRDCDQPPLAQLDRPPLDGQFRAGQTTTWKIGDPVHDERAIPLVGPDGQPLAPGRYTLLLGVYPAGQPQLDARLPAASPDATVRGGTRLVLAEVTIGAP
jgi:hypothetical protein